MAVFFSATAVFAGAELEIKKETEYKFCEIAKETGVVEFTKFDARGERETFCLKCVCSKDSKCYPVKTKCPDEKNNK